MENAPSKLDKNIVSQFMKSSENVKCESMSSAVLNAKVV